MSSTRNKGAKEGDRRRKIGGSAFSIVELLVAVAVLAVLVTLLTGAFSLFSQVAATTSRRLETGKQARTVFDRLAIDLDLAVNNRGVVIEFLKNQGLGGEASSQNDALLMLANVRSQSSDSRLAVVGYGVGTYQNKGEDFSLGVLHRYTAPFSWDDDTKKLALPEDAEAQPMAEGVLRFELAFVNDAGQIVVEIPTDEEEREEFMSTLKSVVCTIVTLDEQSLRKLDDSQRTSLAQRFRDAEAGKMPLEEWQKVNLSDLPQPVAENIRFHQRYFRLK